MGRYLFRYFTLFISFRHLEISYDAYCVQGNRLGFVKMALRHNCTIVPVVNVGTEDITRIHYDLPIGWVPVPFLYGSDRTVPVFTPDVKQMQRLYFHFGQPINVSTYVPDGMYVTSDGSPVLVELFVNTSLSLMTGRLETLPVMI